jgi:hypothetical protein
VHVVSFSNRFSTLFIFYFLNFPSFKVLFRLGIFKFSYPVNSLGWSF